MAAMESGKYPPETSELGSLTAQSNEDSQFVGSSSGVYFINTVKQAFSSSLGTSGSPGAAFPTAEDTLVGTEDSPRDRRQRTSSFKTATAVSAEADDSPTQWVYDPATAADLGSAPPMELAKDLMMMYFKVWHPLFPFLHGPTFLQEMERLYAGRSTSSPTYESHAHHRSICWTAIFQCVFNLASLLRSDLHLPPESQIQSPSCINPLLGTLSSRHDVTSLQALLSVQVYLVATMSLRPASTVGGCILRAMLHAGLHRCPFRYSELSSHDRHLRKRIFWCAYAIDRYLSQALGLPLGIQDSDTDVCLPAAPEMHVPRRRKSPAANSNLPGQNLPQDSRTRKLAERDRENIGSVQLSHGARSTVDHEQEDQRRRESMLASYVDSGTLTGRALELFHKSIVVRSVRRSSVLFLVTDVHKWWNRLPLVLQGRSSGSKKNETSRSCDIPFDFGPFFTVLYQHLILLIHRPSLSLDPSTAEFNSGLQTCIGAARGIISALRAQVDGQQALFWPGFLSAAWMSGLVLAFACQLKQYVLTKGLEEIDECLEFLHAMSAQWETARHCHTALSLLSTNIKQTENDPRIATSSQTWTFRSPGRHPNVASPSALRAQKRLKLSNDPAGASDDDGISAAVSPSAEPCNTEQRGDADPNRSESQSSYAPLVNNPETENSRFRDQFSFSSLAGPPPLANTDPSEQSGASAEAPPSSLELTFPDAESNYLTDGSNFDLNMVDLLRGANFDSLFDLIGQQYPSF